MLRLLTKNKKGFTIVELVVVLLLLSLGVLALGNMLKVTYRAFNKAEERSIKQEAVKFVAETLRSGQTNVASAMSADIFDTAAVVPTVNADQTYSYLFFEPHASCSNENCEASWDFENKRCSGVTKEEIVTTDDDKTEVLKTYCSGERGMVDGYYIKCLNRGMNPESAIQISDVPIYIEFSPMLKDKSKAGSAKNNKCGVIITISALEDDFIYENKGSNSNDVDLNKLKLNSPTSDDIYYSLDVAYHFPNMVLSENNITVNYRGRELTQTNTYDSNGTISETPVEAVNENGIVLRVYSDAIISADSSNTMVKPPELCFIATASYGHDSGEVGLLCNFRDECLLTNPLGTAFVKAYYKLSPPIADFIRDSEPLKAVVRVALKPLVAIATNALDEEAAAQNAPWFIMFMLCGAGATATLIKVDKRRKKIKD